MPPLASVLMFIAIYMPTHWVCKFLLLFAHGAIVLLEAIGVPLLLVNFNHLILNDNLIFSVYLRWGG